MHPTSTKKDSSGYHPYRVAISPDHLEGHWLSREGFKWLRENVGVCENGRGDGWYTICAPNEAPHPSMKCAFFKDQEAATLFKMFFGI
jgi:hypothetical protein